MLATATQTIPQNKPTVTPFVTGKGRGVRLHLHPGQSKAWDASERFVAVISGAQSGKTGFGPWWLSREIQRRGNGDYIAATATYDLFKLKMLPEMKSVFVRLMGWGWAASDRILYSPGYDMDNPDKGSRIILRSAEAEGGLESATAKGGWFDEAGQDNVRLAAWEAMQRRMALNEGRILITTTPYNLGWLKTEVYDRWHAGDANYRVINFKSIMNPAFPRAEYERIRGITPAWKFEMFYNGNFTRPAGMIFGDLTDLHQVEDFAIPPEWPRYVGVDPSGIHIGIVYIALDPVKNIYYVYRCTLEERKPTREHVEAALRSVVGENVVMWTGGSGSEVQNRSDWAEYGLPLQKPSVIDVEPGLDRVIGLIKPMRLFLFKRGARLLWDEMNIYARELDDRGQPTEKIKDKETFHLIDALRYGVIGFTGGDWYMS